MFLIESQESDAITRVIRFIVLLLVLSNTVPVHCTTGSVMNQCILPNYRYLFYNIRIKLKNLPHRQSGWE